MIVQCILLHAVAKYTCAVVMCDDLTHGSCDSYYTNMISLLELVQFEGFQPEQNL